MSIFGDRRLIAQASLALVVANVRFWLTIAPLVARQLKRWEENARTINDPTLRTLALEKLEGERFNSEVAATLATLAPRARRKPVVEAIVAYEVMYDYLDGLTEQPADDPLRNGSELYRAFTDAISPDIEPSGGYYALHRQQNDNGYLLGLVEAVRSSLQRLPSATAISETSRCAAQRCAEAQIRAHAAPALGNGQLERWALQNARVPLGWQAYLAGSASSVLAVHALIAAAADERTTVTDAREIDATYFSICVLSTMLDSLVDYESDQQTGRAGYVCYYSSNERLALDLERAAQLAVEHALLIRNSAHHVMTLVGVAAYYLSAPTATSPFAQPITRRIRSQFEPLITPTLAVMGTWRAAKRARGLRTRRTR